MIEVLLWVVGIYLFTSLSLYSWSVVKTYEIVGVWDFKIHEDRIGVCKYPKWALGWVYKLVGVKTIKI